jgi:uncharacterized protein with HEPN domain
LIVGRHEQLIRDMANAAQNAISFLDGISEEQFLSDNKTQHAVIMCLHIIGESAARMERKCAEFVKQHPELLLHEMRGLRNRIAHGYFTINLHIVWQTVMDDLPKLVAQLSVIQSEMD